MLSRRQACNPFPVRLHTFEVDAHDSLHRSLVPLLLQSSRTLPTVPRGELLGWQSDSDLLHWGAQTAALVPVFGEAVLAAASLPATTEVSLTAWANVFTPHTHFTPHIHSGSAWSGVYFLEAGDSAHSVGGVLCFGDPRAGAGMVQSGLRESSEGSTFAVVPTSGQLVVFPAWLSHWVTPYRSNNPRISVSFNAV